jgi:hypothetical protein
MGAYFFRRLTNNGNYPICSWLVAHSYSKAGKYFGCEPGAAEPDDIWDFVKSNTEKYKEIYHINSIWNKQKSMSSSRNQSLLKTDPTIK